MKCQIVLAAMALGVVSVFACTGETGTEGSHKACWLVVETEPVSSVELTAAGRPSDLAARATQASAAELHWVEWPGGTQKASALSLHLVADPSTALRLKRETPGFTQPCRDAIQMNATLTFATADGAFNEVFTGTLSSADGQVRFDADRDLERVRGTYHPTGFPESLTLLRIQLFLPGESTSGSLLLEPKPPDAGRSVAGQASAEAGWW